MREWLLINQTKTEALMRVQPLLKLLQHEVLAYNRRR